MVKGEGGDLLNLINEKLIKNLIQETKNSGFNWEKEREKLIEYIDMLVLLKWGCRTEFIEVGSATKINHQGCYIFSQSKIGTNCS